MTIWPEMEKLFSTDMPFLRFARNVFVVSCLSLIPLLLVYVAGTPGFGSMLLAGGPALSRFLRQVLTNGLPVVFVVNYLSFFLYALIVAKGGQDRSISLILLIDLPARVVAFVLLHAVIYVASASWFGSFRGDRLIALSVVGPTLARSALFENISGVYLYATLVSALPLYTFAIEKKLARNTDPPSWFHRRVERLPGRSGSVLLALGLFALFVLALTAVALAITKLQSGWG